MMYGSLLSYSFEVVCGVRHRQDGILSPLLFNVQADDLICQLDATIVLVVYVALMAFILINWVMNVNDR